MSRRRLVPLALVVTLLLAIVAIAARGHPLGKDDGSSSGVGLPNTFWSFFFTTLVIVEVLLMVVGLVALVMFRHERTEVARYNPRTLRALLILILGVALFTYLERHFALKHLHHALGPPRAKRARTATGKNAHRRSAPQNLHFQWEELVIVLVVLLALAVAAVVTRRARLGPGRRDRAAPETLAA
ncbi:MAG TPA: hypothetical protein VJ716_04750, partial [Gaiellaceae bacterium]|nr:hypothetical protein [Gaiellaceae bacterium]